MIDAIDSMMRGEGVYPAAFRRAKAFWGEFFAQHGFDDDLQGAIEREQTAFQWAMEDVGLAPPLAKDVMAWTCVASLYEDGFADPDLARRVVRAMSTSRSLSLGIPSSAEEVARFYGL